MPQRSKPPPIEIQIPVCLLVITERRIVILDPLIRTLGVRDARSVSLASTTSCAVCENLTTPSIVA